MIISFKPIPNTSLFIASAGESQSRIIYITDGNLPHQIHQVPNTRIVIINTPHNLLRHYMKEGKISRPILGELTHPISGDSYQKLRIYLDDFLKK